MIRNKFRCLNHAWKYDYVFFVSEDGLSQMKTKRREQTETNDELLKQDDKYIHILQKQIEFPKPY